MDMWFCYRWNVIAERIVIGIGIESVVPGWPAGHWVVVVVEP